MKRVGIITTIDRRSAVARATLGMANALSELCDVTVYAEPTAQPLHCALSLRSIDDAQVAANDHVVTVVGNSPFHVNAFHAARRTPSVVILHDVLMAHLVAASLPTSELRHEFTRFYGPERAAAAMRGAESPLPAWDGPNALDAPLFEAVIESATGIVVHSNFAQRVVAPTTIAPVTVIPLAYASPFASLPIDREVSDRPLLVTLGHTNVNKCHELVIEALADLGRPDVRYVVAGPISEQRRRHLTLLASALGVAEQIEIVGSIGDQDVAHLLADADLCINLRLPAVEAGSASLVEQMAAGKCVVVFDHGCYADAPDDAVVKLPLGSTPQSLGDVLGELLGDVARREAVGTRARSHAASEHSYPVYATRLLRSLDAVSAVEPMNRVARDVASITRSWGMPHGSPLAHRYALAIRSMTAGKDTTPQ